MKHSPRKWELAGRILLLCFATLWPNTVLCADQEHEVQASLDPSSVTLEQPRGIKDPERFKKIFDEIYEKKNTSRKSAERLKEAYHSLKVRKLRDIPPSDYKSFSQYLYNKNVYIIVHPAYYLFFQNKVAAPPGEFTGGFPALNLVDRFTRDLPPDASPGLKAMVEQGRLLEDFLQYFSTEKRLVILILPRDYLSHLSYGYVPGQDEYARYLNEITNMSESVLYLESSSWETGSLADEDLEMLTSFIRKVGGRNILVGGGYLGKCLDNFYETIRKNFKHRDIFIVVELAALAPLEIDTDILNPDGRVNFNKVKRLYLKNYGATFFGDEKPLVKRITSYPVYR